jgi:putative transposase
VSGLDGTMIDFKGVHYPRAVILYAVFFYLRYAVDTWRGLRPRT